MRPVLSSVPSSVRCHCPLLGWRRLPVHAQPVRLNHFYFCMIERWFANYIHSRNYNITFSTFFVLPFHIHSGWHMSNGPERPTPRVQIKIIISRRKAKGVGSVQRSMGCVGRMRWWWVEQGAREREKNGFVVCVRQEMCMQTLQKAINHFDVYLVE